MNMQVTGFLRMKQVLELLPVARSTLYSWIKQGKFPKPVKLGPKISAWRMTDIMDHMRTIQAE
jgi:prophage regulatory protein